jgi:hypothetical protein
MQQYVSSTSTLQHTVLLSQHYTARLLACCQPQSCRQCCRSHSLLVLLVLVLVLVLALALALALVAVAVEAPSAEACHCHRLRTIQQLALVLVLVVSVLPAALGGLRSLETMPMPCG